MRHSIYRHGIVAALGGALLLAAGWLGRVPNGQPLLWLLWMGGLLLIAVSSTLLTDTLQGRIGWAGRWLLWLALGLSIVGSLGALAEETAIVLLLPAGMFLLPLALLICGWAMWREDGPSPATLLALTIGVVTGPLAILVGLVGATRDPGWQLWIIGVGVGWLALGLAWLTPGQRHAECHA